MKYYLLILPILLCLIYACQEELSTILFHEKGKQNQDIRKAKAIFEALSPDFPCLQARSANAATKSVIIEPVWEGAFVDENEEYQTVESNITLSKPFYMMDKSAYDAYKQTNNPRYMNYLSRAVVLTHKKTGVTDAFIMTIIGSKKYLEEHDFQLWDVSYCNIPDDFSGMILYYSLNGTFVNGWQVKENKQILPCQPISREDANLLARNSTGCYYVEVTNTYVECITYAGTTFVTYEGEQFSYDFSDVVCGDPYDETYTYMVCDDDSNQTSNNNSGGYSPPQLSNGKKLFNKYTGITFEKIEEFIKYLRTTDCISQKILSYFEEDSIPNYEPVNLSIDPNKASVARYDTLQNTIYLNHLDNFKNIYMYEEIIHVIQYYKYSKEEIKNGALNMEFEAKLLIDYIFVRENGYLQTDLQQIMGTKEGDKPILYDYLLSDEVLPFRYDNFFHYLKLWKKHTETYNNLKMDSTLVPKIIPHIVNQLGTSCLSPF